LNQQEKRRRKEGRVLGNICCVNCDEIDSAGKRDRGAGLPTGIPLSLSLLLLLLLLLLLARLLYVSLLILSLPNSLALMFLLLLLLLLKYA